VPAELPPPEAEPDGVIARFVAWLRKLLGG
jgi:hypothetical protein